LEDSSDGVDLSLVDIIFLVQNDVLTEECAFTWSLLIIGCEVGVLVDLIENVVMSCVEEPEQVIREPHFILLNKGLVDDTSSVLQVDPDVVEEVVDRLRVVPYVEVLGCEDLLDKYWSEPFLKFFLRSTVISRTSLINKSKTTVNRSIPVALDCEICPVRAKVRANTVHVKLFFVLIKEVTTKLALRSWDFICFKIA
jgi:hypothetical protein